MFVGRNPAGVGPARPPDERTCSVAVTVRQLAEWVRGEVVGDGEQLIHAARPVTDAAAGELTFIEDDKHLPLLDQSPAAAFVVGPTVSAPGKTLVRVADPLMAFVTIVQKL